MLDHHELFGIRRSLPEGLQAASSMVVLDLREQDWKLNHVFFRRWSQVGVVCRTSLFNPEETNTWLFEVKGRRPIVLIGEEFDENASWLWTLAGCDGFVKLSCSVMPKPMGAAPVDHFPFSVEGIESFQASTHDLPMTVSVRLSVNAEQNVLLIRPLAEDKQLPSAQWFRISAATGAELERLAADLDIEPGHFTDTWSLSSRGCQMTRMDPPTEAVNTRLQAATVVFDRTCPQNGHWSAAKSLSNGGWSSAEKSTAGPPGFGALQESDTGPKDPRDLKPEDPRDLNREIRESVAESLLQYLSDGPCRIDSIAFADDARDGLSWPMDAKLSVPEAVSAWTGNVQSSELLRHFNTYTYSLGLDLWDALDLAMNDVVENLRGRTVNHAGVLIIGNSPPAPPHGIQGAYSRLMRADPGRIEAQLDNSSFTSTLRRSGRFSFRMDDLARMRVPCAFLFLEHTRFDPSDERAASFFRKLQKLLVDALRESVKVFTCTADREGIRAGVKNALGFLSDPPRSGVRVYREYK